MDGTGAAIYQQSDELGETVGQPQSRASCLRCCTRGLSKRRNKSYNRAIVPEKTEMNMGITNRVESVLAMVGFTA